MGSRLFLPLLGALALLVLLWLVRRGEKAPALEPSSVPVEKVEAVAPPERGDPAHEGSQREALPVSAGPGIDLTLVRFPDEAPLAHATVTTVPPTLAPEGGEPATEANGDERVARPA